MSKEGDDLRRALGPLRLFFGPLISVAEQVKKRLDEELLDETQVYEELQALNQKLEAGEIGEEAFEEQEEALLKRLEWIQEQKEQR